MRCSTSRLGLAAFAFAFWCARHWPALSLRITRITTQTSNEVQGYSFVRYRGQPHNCNSTKRHQKMKVQQTNSPQAVSDRTIGRLVFSAACSKMKIQRAQKGLSRIANRKSSTFCVVIANMESNMNLPTLVAANVKSSILSVLVGGGLLGLIVVWSWVFTDAFYATQRPCQMIYES